MNFKISNKYSTSNRCKNSTITKRQSGHKDASSFKMDLEASILSVRSPTVCGGQAASYKRRPTGGEIPLKGKGNPLNTDLQGRPCGAAT